MGELKGARASVQYSELGGVSQGEQESIDIP